MKIVDYIKESTVALDNFAKELTAFVYEIKQNIINDLIKEES
jgi:hypothetical protein